MISRASLRGTRIAAVLCLCLAGAAGCGRGEKKGVVATPRAEAPSPTAAVDLSPHISESPSTAAGPFGSLKFERGIAVDEKGRLWVADFGNAAIRVFDAAGALYGGWGGHGEGTWAMKDPCGIAVHGSDVYVSDTWRTGVERFDAAGRFQGKLAADLYGAHGVAVGRNGTVYIADTGNNRVLLCKADLTEPRAVGKSGAGPEQFASPVAVAVGPSGDVYVTDTGNRRIQVLDASGAFKTIWKFSGWGADAEAYVETDTDGSLYVSDPVGRSVVRLDSHGVERRRWTTDQSGKSFLKPTGVALDRKKRILYVADTDSSSIARISVDGK